MQNRRLTNGRLSDNYKTQLVNNIESSVNIYCPTSSQNIDKSSQPELSTLQFSFNQANHIQTTDNNTRIHGKQATKRVGGKVIVHGHQQKRLNQAKKNQKVGRIMRSYLRESDDNLSESINLIHIKSYETENQRKWQNRYRSSIQSNGNIMRNSIQSKPSNNGISQSNIQSRSKICEKTAEEMFQMIDQKMQQQKQNKRSLQKNRKCFYYNLRRKLQKQMAKTHEQTEIARKALLIYGCNKERHKRHSSDAKLATDRSRLKTPLMISRDNVTDYSLKRPLTSRSNQREQEDHRSAIAIFRKESKDVGQQTELKAENRSVRHYSRCYQQNPANMAKHKRIENSSKMKEIISSCDSYVANCEINKRLKAFEYYCQKIDQKLYKKQQLLTNINFNLNNYQQM